MTYIILLLSITAPVTLANSCSYEKRPTIVPRLKDDADAQHMCGKYYCEQELGSEWDYAGHWSNSEDGNTSICYCVKKNCDCTVPMGDAASSSYEPEDYSKAQYHWEQNGCMLGWSSSYVNQTEYYGTCGPYLGACPWENRNLATRVVKSPVHCQVTKVSFKLAGGVSRISDPTRDNWMGVKLIDDDENVVKFYSRTTNSDDQYDDITWDDLAGYGCYRVVLQDGQVGDWSYLKLQDVEVWTDADVQNMMLSDLKCKISSDNTKAVWPVSFTERLVGFGVEWGVDNEGSRAVNGRMSVGASYIYQNSDHPTVVTDVMIATVPRIYDDVASCPRGYERSCFWLPDIDGTDGFDTLSITPLRTLGGVGTALCVKKMPCNAGQEYVKRIVARAGSGKTVPKTSGDCKIIGRWNPADGPEAKSWISGETGSKWVALYQCKDKCPHKECARIVIRTMEKSSVPEINASSKASGDTISISKQLPNCYGTAPMKWSGKISTNEAITSQTSYTFSKDVAHSFDADISASATFTATVGFKMFGEDAEVSKSRSIGLSADAGWSSDYKSGLTNTTQILNTHGTTSTGSFTVQPGEVAFVTADVTSFEYSTKFVAEADCVDAVGDVIETTKLDGVFRGRTYKTDGTFKTSTRACFPDECSCSAEKHK